LELIAIARNGAVPFGFGSVCMYRLSQPSATPYFRAPPIPCSPEHRSANANYRASRPPVPLPGVRRRREVSATERWVKSEEPVQVQSRFTAAARGSRNRDLWTHGCVSRIAERYDHRNAIGGSALEDRVSESDDSLQSPRRRDSAHRLYAAGMMEPFRRLSAATPADFRNKRRDSDMDTYLFWNSGEPR
jgi:hypothetical protein